MTSARVTAPTAVALAVAALAAAAVGVLEPKLARTMHALAARDDVFALPPPKTLDKLTLGWRAATVDQLWAKLLVENGVHHAEHRSFSDLTRYIDSIIELEPDYAPIYEFVDSLILYQPRPKGEVASKEELESGAEKARGYLEIGLDHRPFDARLWLQYGQFLAFLAPSFLSSGEQKLEWRKSGSFAILHAVELGASADMGISAASILAKMGQKSAIVEHLKRSYALADDPEVRAELAARIREYESQAASEATTEDVAFIERQLADMRFVPRGMALQLGPSVDAFACAGGELGPFRAARERDRASTDPNSCARDWTARLPSQASSP